MRGLHATATGGKHRIGVGRRPHETGTGDSFLTRVNLKVRVGFVTFISFGWRNGELTCGHSGKKSPPLRPALTESRNTTCCVRRSACRRQRMMTAVRASHGLLYLI